MKEKTETIEINLDENTVQKIMLLAEKNNCLLDDYIEKLISDYLLRVTNDASKNPIAAANTE